MRKKYWDFIFMVFLWSSLLSTQGTALESIDAYSVFENVTGLRVLNPKDFRVQLLDNAEHTVKRFHIDYDFPARTINNAPVRAAQASSACKYQK